MLLQFQKNMASKRSVVKTFDNSKNNVCYAFEEVKEYFSQAIVQAAATDCSAETRLETIIEAVENSPLPNIKLESDNGFQTCKKEVVSLFGAVMKVIKIKVDPDGQEFARLLGVENSQLTHIKD